MQIAVLLSPAVPSSPGANARAWWSKTPPWVCSAGMSQERKSVLTICSVRSQQGAKHKKSGQQRELKWERRQRATIRRQGAGVCCGIGGSPRVRGGATPSAQTAFWGVTFEGRYRKRPGWKKERQMSRMRIFSFSPRPTVEPKGDKAAQQATGHEKTGNTIRE
mgnify:CR=1 FL=1